MLGKLVPYCILGFVEGCTVLIVMRVIFRISINGNLLLLLTLVVLSCPFSLSCAWNWSSDFNQGEEPDSSHTDGAACYAPFSFVIWLHVPARINADADQLGWISNPGNLFCRHYAWDSLKGGGCI